MYSSDYLALAAKRIGEPVQAVPDNATKPLEAGCGEDFCELIGDRPSHFFGLQRC
jgi:hypothetical protein